MLAIIRRAAALIPALALLTLASGTTASADPSDGSGLSRGPTDASVLALITDDDLFSIADLSVLMASPTAVGSGPTQHYGPYASGSPDSGTCGNDWADDTFDRHFTVRQDGPTSFTVVEQFKRGSFTTVDGPSPGACDATDGTPPGTIRAAVVGSMHGYEVINITGSQFSTDPSCGTSPCTTSGFIASHFTGASEVGTYFFHYAAGDQALVEHEWKNASADRGGNHGDIADVQLP